MSKVAPAPVEEATGVAGGRKNDSRSSMVQNGTRSMVVSKNELDELVNKEAKKRENEMKAKLEAEIEASMAKKYEENWQGRVDVELEKNDTWSARIKGAEDRAKLAERKLFVCEEKLDTQGKVHAKKLKEIEDNQKEMKKKLEESEKLIKDMKESEHDSSLRIANLESQLSTQSGRAESLEQSYAAELEKSEKQAEVHRQEIASLKRELEMSQNKIREIESKQEQFHEESQQMVLGQKKDESSKMLFTFVSARMRRAVIIAMAKWKLYNLDYHHSDKRTHLISDHNHEVSSLRRNKEEELLKTSNEAAQLRLNYEATIRDLTLELQRMEAALVEVARPQIGGPPAFTRALALKRCNFG